MTAVRTTLRVSAVTALVMLLVELIAHAGVLAHQSRNAVTFESLAAPVKENYAHMRPADVEELLRDTAASRWRYEPVAGLVVEQQHTRFINVNAEGARSNGTGFNAIDGAIWFFGGSTTFGYGVADNETIPAYLEARLQRPVLNLGVPGHYSVLETRLLSQYLRVGYRPALAVFLDGVNENCESDIAEAELGGLVALSQNGYWWQPARPVVVASRLLLAKAARLAGWIDNDTNKLELTCRSAGREFPLASMTSRSLAERAAICRLYALECRTFVQPFAGMHGRHEVPADNFSAVYLRGLYEHLEPAWRRSNATFVTMALDSLQHHAYVDDVHYSAAAHRLLAAAIADRLSVTVDP